MNSQLPQTLEDTILRYLRSQEQFPAEGDEHDNIISLIPEVKEDPEEKIRQILENLLLKVNKRIICKDHYENLNAWHGQYALFNLEDYILDFCLDEETMNRIAFRETVLISNLDAVAKRESQPKAVGGMVVSVQLVDACIPDERPKMKDNEQDIQLLHIVQKAREAVSAKSSISLDYEDVLQQKLMEYEAFLKKQMEKNAKKFVVHVSSQFNVGENAGSRITAWVDRNLHTLEEKRLEYVLLPKENLDNNSKDYKTIEKQNINEKSLYVALQCQKYYLHHKSKLDNFEERKYYKLSKSFGLICEGASFILMRYLALKRYCGKFELSTMYINGDMCRNIYDCTGPQKGNVNEEEVEICKIYRYIIEECGIEHHCVTVLTTYGRIISQEWEGCNYILNINPLIFVGDTAKLYEKYNLKKTWIDDMELLSKYLDCKTDAEKKMKTYMSDHPEVKEMMADYLNNILMLKPDNILSYTMNYFQGLFPINMGRMTFLIHLIV